MPSFTLTVSGERNPALIAQAVPALTSIGVETLHKRADLTVVTVRFVPREDWFIDNTSLAQMGLESFRLEVTITEGTNTREEKAAFHERAFATLERLIGNVHHHSSIHVVDCRGDSYGYGGVTQDRRFHRG